MANGLIGKITAGGGTHLIASTAYFTCATAKATAAKVAAAADTNLDNITLMTGLTIYVKFTNHNEVANPTLALYKSDGTTNLVAAKSIMRYGTTTAYQSAAGSWRDGAVVAFTYDGTNWVEHSSIDDNSNDTGYYVRHIYTNIKAGSVGIFPYTIIMQRNDGRWDSIVTSSSTGTSKACNTNGFVLGQIMLMYANKTYAADANVDTYNVWQMHSGLIDHRYSFNTANNATSGTAAKKPVYLVGTVTNGLFYLDTTKWWATALPTSADGKIYIYIGESYDYYKLTFAGYHPIYHYTNGALRLYGGDASTVNGQVLGTLATKSSIANHSYTPAGTITLINENTTTTVSAASSGTTTYTPGGTVSQPTFTGSSLTSTGNFTPAGSVSVSTNNTTNKTATVSAASSGTTTYTPAGTNSAPAFTGTAATIVVNGGTGTATYTPAGTIAVNGTTSTATVIKTATFNTVVTSATVANEILTISTGTAGSSTNQTGVRIADPAYKFTGTGTRLTASYTPAGSVAAPTFSGTAVRLVTGNIPVPSSYTATFTGTQGSVSVSGTPAGTVSQPTFSGTAVRLVTGNISRPTSATFSGTAATLSHTVS